MEEYSRPLNSVGHFLRLVDDKNRVQYRFQNFYIQENVRITESFRASDARGTYSFVPFGFSGLSSSRQGDLAPATLVFHSNDISRAYLLEALGGYEGAGTELGLPDRAFNAYTAEVDVCLLPNDGEPLNDRVNRLFTYVGRATNGGWNASSLSIELTSVIDAVQDSVPTLTLQQQIVGSLPMTSSVSI